jgi:hypothetical protein
MPRDLVLIHGRSQQHKDSVALKHEWIDAWSTGLQKSGLSLPIAESAIHFPYYGDTLDALSTGADDVPDVLVRGAQNDSENELMRVVASVLEEARLRAGISDRDVRAAAEAYAGDVPIERGPMNWPWVRGIVEALDRVPGLNGRAVSLATADVWRYLNHAPTRNAIDNGVRQALPRESDAVVVGHSLGSVVAYQLLKNDARFAGWRVPLYVTIGSPLGVRAIRRCIVPTKRPDGVGHWFNAMDPLDVVALYPLDAEHFDIGQPPIENKTDVENGTPNRHGAEGYLADAFVAKRIYDALVAQPLFRRSNS